MGTSGETFIGFVNLLFEQQHDVGILENVQGAEWDKMAYYIEGRLPLRSVAPGGGGAKVHELRFEVAGDAFVVSEASEPSSGLSPRTSPYLPISRRYCVFRSPSSPPLGSAPGCLASARLARGTSQPPRRSRPSSNRAAAR